MANIYRPLKIWNGSAWDYIYLDIMESCIKGGWTQSFTTGVNQWRYRKLPGGAVIVGGAVHTVSFVADSANGGYNGSFNFPFTMAEVPVVIPCVDYGLGFARCGVVSVSKTGATVRCDAKANNLWIDLLIFGQVA